MVAAKRCAGAKPNTCLQRLSSVRPHQNWVRGKCIFYGQVPSSFWLSYHVKIHKCQVKSSVNHWDSLSIWWQNLRYLETSGWLTISCFSSGFGVQSVLVNENSQILTTNTKETKKKIPLASPRKMFWFDFFLFSVCYFLLFPTLFSHHLSSPPSPWLAFGPLVFLLP